MKTEMEIRAVNSMTYFFLVLLCKKPDYERLLACEPFLIELQYFYGSLIDDGVPYDDEVCEIIADEIYEQEILQLESLESFYDQVYEVAYRLIRTDEELAQKIKLFYKKIVEDYLLQKLAFDKLKK